MIYMSWAEDTTAPEYDATITKFELNDESREVRRVAKRVLRNSAK